MATSIDAPKVFISYSWKPIYNKQRTIALAERLENEGVNVIIDEWNLAEGQDKYQFMEQMVNNSEVKRVLIICNEEYADKANKKSGGVGIESLIISDEVYSKADQTKFIPIIFERSPEGKEFVPTFIKSRIYIDLSNDEVFEDEYEKLMRNIFDKPASKRPPRGMPPSYILQEDSTFLRTTHKVKTILNALVNEKMNAQVFIDDYYSTFIEALIDFEINNEDLQKMPNIDDLVIARIDEMKLLRDDFVTFLETIFTYSANLNMDKFISFIERLLEFIMRQESSKYPGRTIGSYMSDQYKFFYYELFLYLTAVMIEKEKFKELGGILNTGFVIFNQRINKTESYNFLLFNHYAESLNKLRNERLQMMRINITADLIKQRADLQKYTFDKLSEYDILLYFIGIMQNESANQWLWRRWFPHTTVYRLYSLPLLEKLISKRHFEKMKFLFNVNTIEELKLKVENTIQIQADKLDRWNYDFPYINQVFNSETIGTYN
jgi:hypothetical protein